MISFLLAWAALTAACVPPGLAVLRLSRADCFERPSDRFVLAAWLGLVLICCALLGLSLFVSLSPSVGAAVALAAAGPALMVRAVREEIAGFGRLLTPGVAACLLALAAGVAALTTQPVWYFDTGLYHYGFIKWLSRFGTVEGLGLLHYRFSVATSWFALSAVFDAGPLVGRMNAVLGGFTLLLFLLHLAAAAARCLSGRAGRADWLLAVSSGLCAALVVYGMTPRPAYWQAAVSPSPDFPVNVLTILVAWAIVLVVESGGRAERGRLLDASLVPLLLAAGALTIRASAAPLVAVAGLFYALRGGPFVSRFLAGGAVVLPFLAVVVAYQTITSGCPFFPVPVCLDVPWSVGAERARSFVEAVRDYGRWLGEDHDGADRFGWIRPWLLMGLKRADLWLLAVSGVGAAGCALLNRLKGGGRLWRRAAWACGLLFVAVLGLRGQNLLLIGVTAAALAAAFGVARRVPGGAWLLALGAAGSFLTLYSGPALRFGLGYVSVLFGCLALLLKGAGDGAPRLQRVGPRAVFAALLLAFGVCVNTERAANSVLNYLPAALRPAAAVAPAPDGGRRAVDAPAAPEATPTTDGTREAAPSAPTAGGAREAVQGVAGEPGAGGFRSRLLLPPPLFAGLVARRRVNNLDYFRAEKYAQCWASELPCAPEDLPPFVALRDPSRGLAAGFVNAGR